MELRQLKYFLAVADGRSFVRGAAEQYISRQAISKAISQLEAELNVELFMRDSSGAFLTPAGVMFYERVRNAVLELEQLQAEMQQLGSRFRQTIRIGFSIGTLDLYEEPLRQFREQQSNLSVSHFECAPKVCAGLLTERQADVVITSAPPDNKQFYCQPILSAPLTVAVSEAVTDWKTLPLCCFDDGQTEDLCRDAELSVQSSGIDLGRLARMAREGSCGVILPLCLFPAYLPGIHPYPLPNTQPWQLFRVSLASMESNALFPNALDTLTAQVLTKPKPGGAVYAV